MPRDSETILNQGTASFDVVHVESAPVFDSTALSRRSFPLDPAAKNVFNRRFHLDTDSGDSLSSLNSFITSLPINENLVTSESEKEKWFYQRWLAWLIHGSPRDKQGILIYEKPKSVLSGASFYSVWSFALVDLAMPTASFTRWSTVLSRWSVLGEIGSPAELLIVGMVAGACFAPLGVTFNTRNGHEVLDVWYENYAELEKKRAALAVEQLGIEELLPEKIDERGSEVSSPLDENSKGTGLASYYANMGELYQNAMVGARPAAIQSSALLHISQTFESFKWIHRPVFYWSRLSFLLLTTFEEPGTALFNTLVGVFSAIGVGLLTTSIIDNKIWSKRRFEEPKLVINELNKINQQLFVQMLDRQIIELNQYLIKRDDNNDQAVLNEIEILANDLKEALSTAELAHLTLLENSNGYLFQKADLLSALFPHVTPWNFTGNRHADYYLSVAKRSFSSSTLMQAIRYGGFPISVTTIVLWFIPGAVLAGPAGWAVLGVCVAFFAIAVITQAVKNYNRDHENFHNERELERLTARENKLIALTKEKFSDNKNLEKITEEIERLEKDSATASDTKKLQKKLFLVKQKNKLQALQEEFEQLEQPTFIADDKAKKAFAKTFILGKNQFPRDTYIAGSPVEKKWYNHAYDKLMWFNDWIRPSYRTISAGQVAMNALDVSQHVMGAFAGATVVTVFLGLFSANNEARIDDEARWLKYQLKTKQQNCDKLQRIYMQMQVVSKSIDKVMQEGAVPEQILLLPSALSRDRATSNASMTGHTSPQAIRRALHMATNPNVSPKLKADLNGSILLDPVSLATADPVSHIGGGASSPRRMSSGGSA